MAVDWKDRITGLERVRASELAHHPRNWRRHGDHQKHALRAIIEQVGLVDAVLARRRDDGRLELIDGHLRQELGQKADQVLPVLVLDVTSEEADQILATFHPIAAMAETEQARFAELVAKADLEDEKLRKVIQGMAILDKASQGIPEGADGKEYNESCADGVAMTECPNCGHKYPL